MMCYFFSIFVLYTGLIQRRELEQKDEFLNRGITPQVLQAEMPEDKAMQGFAFIFFFLIGLQPEFAFGLSAQRQVTCWVSCQTTSGHVKLRSQCEK